MSFGLYKDRVSERRRRSLVKTLVKWSAGRLNSRRHGIARTAALVGGLCRQILKTKYIRGRVGGGLQDRRCPGHDRLRRERGRSALFVGQSAIRPDRIV